MMTIAVTYIHTDLNSINMPRMTPEERAQHKKDLAKRHRQYLATLTPEELERRKTEARWRREDAIRDREVKAEMKEHKAILAKAKAVLSYMKKTDVLYHHHGRSDSMMSSIISALDSLKHCDRDSKRFTIKYKDIELPRHNEYHSYYWNYNSAQSSYMPKAQLGCLWYGPFDTIYDVPLDGTYTFYIYDSGSRGLGSMNHISAKLTEKETVVPYVNPGAIIPITVF